MYDECIMALYDYDVWNEHMHYCNIVYILYRLINFVRIFLAFYDPAPESFLVKRKL